MELADNERFELIQKVIDFLKQDETERTGKSYDIIDTKFETSPSDYISFAETDIESGLEHRYINALSNAKRALDCQADRILKCIGYFKLSKKKFWGFPKKIELINRLDILAPRILKKINKIRNLMEHDYIKPKEEQVEDFIDVVALFIASTDKYVSTPWVEVFYSQPKKSIIAITKDKTFDKLDLKIGQDKTTFVNLDEMIFDELTVRIKPENEKISISNFERLLFEVSIGEEFYIELMKVHMSKVYLF